MCRVQREVKRDRGRDIYMETEEGMCGILLTVINALSRERF